MYSRVSTYAHHISALGFWFIGLIPDLATLRDRSEERWKKIIYGMLAIGLARLGPGTGIVTRPRTCCSPVWPRRWCSPSTRWSVFDFAVGIVPGWPHYNLPALLRRRRDLLRLRPWC